MYVYITPQKKNLLAPVSRITSYTLAQLLVRLFRTRHRVRHHGPDEFGEALAHSGRPATAWIDTLAVDSTAPPSTINSQLSTLPVTGLDLTP